VSILEKIRNVLIYIGLFFLVIQATNLALEHVERQIRDKIHGTY
jgi:hypothetical protein